MNAGRELDALIAEKVMGWERIGKGWYTKPEHRQSKDFPGRVINDWDAKGEHDFLVPPGSDGASARDRVAFCGCEGDLEVPYYSTDIGEAWRIVELLTVNNRSFFSLTRYQDYKGPDGPAYMQFWKALFCRTVRTNFEKDNFGPEGEFRGEGSAEAAAHAICLAALMALDSKVR